MQQSLITFDLQIGACNGTMAMQWWLDGNLVLDQPNFKSADFRHSVLISWPCLLSIEVSGKQPMDTLVDDTGNILADKYIKIKSIIIDRMPLEEHLMYKFVSLDTGTDKIPGPYLGFNGKVDLLFDAPDSFSWFLMQQVSQGTSPNITSVLAGNETTIWAKADDKILLI